VRAVLPGARRDPLVAALFCFAIVATLLQYGAPRWLQETLLPYTGWAGLAVPYSFVLYFAASSLAAQDQGSRTRMRRGCLVILVVGACTGLAESLTPGGARISDNPYLRVSAWRPLWTVLVPLLWIGALHWTRPGRDDATPA